MERSARSRRWEARDFYANRRHVPRQIRTRRMRAAVSLHVPLEIEQREPLLHPYQFRMCDVLATPHQASRNLLLRDGFAEFVFQQSAERCRAATQIPTLDHDAIAPHL